MRSFVTTLGVVAMLLFLLPQMAQAALIDRTNEAFRSIHGRSPTVSEWTYWAGRIQRREKTTFAALVGAIAYQNAQGSSPTATTITRLSSSAAAASGFAISKTFYPSSHNPNFLPEGSLVTAPGTPNVYYIRGGKKSWVLPSILSKWFGENHFFKSNIVLTISDSDLARHPSATSVNKLYVGKVLKHPNGSQFYIDDKFRKRPLSASVRTALRIPGGNLYSASAAHLSEFKTGPALTSASFPGGFVKVVDAHPRSLRDWSQEKFTIPYVTAHKIAKQANIKIPPSARKKIWKEHLAKVGIQGRISHRRKYNGRIPVDEEYRKQKWREWWNTIGQYTYHGIDTEPKPIKIPRKSQRLAEFTGIMLGDGGLSQYQTKITLHRKDDREYSEFVKKLIKELFDVPTGYHLHKHALADDIVVSRIELVRFCVNNLGFKIGSKVRQQIDVPDWIKIREEYMVACVRGLIDTDGCVFTHKYKVNGKEYRYKKLGFTNKSKPLLEAVHTCLSNIGLKPRFTNQYDVRLDSKHDIQQYMKIVGSNNPKHLKRYND